jgi:DNA primase
MTLPAAFLDDIRSRTTLSTLVGRRVKLAKAGREFKGLCPVHTEKSPSFTVNDDKGFAHCFGCGFHADAIGWLVQVEGREFIEAVRELAEGAGVAMPERSAEAQRVAKIIDALRPAIEAAQAAFVEQLAGMPRRWLIEARALTEETIDAFGIGFAPRGVLSGRGIGQNALLAAGLIGHDPEMRRTWESFAGRIMVPVHDHRGRLCGFGGRVLPVEWGGLPNADVPKYRNSPDSPIFDKGSLLFNMHRAAPAIREARRAIVVEGYFDAMMLAQVGISEAVAPMGTAITPRQLERLWRHHHCPVLLFDGDAAGIKAARRACEVALPQCGPGRSLSVAALPPGSDPDDLVRNGGRDAVEAVIADAQPMADFLFDDVMKEAA